MCQCHFSANLNYTFPITDIFLGIQYINEANIANKPILNLSPNVLCEATQLAINVKIISDATIHILFGVII